MEQKMITIPFDLELAKKIQNGEHQGKIVTKNGYDARIVCWDAKCKHSVIVYLVSNNGGDESVYSCTNDGNLYHEGRTSDYDLVLQVPEWIQFKDGDVLETSTKDVFVLNGNGSNKTSLYVGLFYGELSYGGAANYDNIEEMSYATEEAKQKLIDALKESTDLRAKECLERFFGIKNVEEYKFQPFDKVLVRDGNQRWHATLFSNYINKEGYSYPYCTVCGQYQECIPFNEATQHLLGTCQDWEQQPEEI